MSQPLPYPGDEPAVATPGSLRREYKDLTGRPLSGTVSIRDSQDFSAPFELVDGVLDVILRPGTYRLLMTLRDPEGKPYYASETVTL